jgi:hypothetical protein
VKTVACTLPMPNGTHIICCCKSVLLNVACYLAKLNKKYITSSISWEGNIWIIHIISPLRFILTVNCFQNLHQNMKHLYIRFIFGKNLLRLFSLIFLLYCKASSYIDIRDKMILFSKISSYIQSFIYTSYPLFVLGSKTSSCESRI